MSGGEHPEDTAGSPLSPCRRKHGRGVAGSRAMPGGVA